MQQASVRDYIRPRAGQDGRTGAKKRPMQNNTSGSAGIRLQSGHTWHETGGGGYVSVVQPGTFAAVLTFCNMVSGRLYLVFINVDLLS